MAKRMIIKGVGTFMAKRYAKDNTAEVITLGKLTDLKIDLNVELEDIFGGDGLFAIDTLVKSKSIEITATDARFDLNALELMMGSKVEEGVDSTLWVLEEMATVAPDEVGSPTCGEVTPKYADTVASGANEFHDFDTDSWQVHLKDSNKLMSIVTSVPSSATEVQWDDTKKKLIFHKDVVGQDVIFNYRRTDTVDMVAILAEEVPFPVSVVHHGVFIQKDGVKRGIETELYACRARGNFSINAARKTAATSQVSLVIIDPERPDGRLGTIKRFELAA